MRWMVDWVIRLGDPRLMKIYHARISSRNLIRLSRRKFRTRTAAEIYAWQWCSRVNRMAEIMEKVKNETQ